MWDLLSPIDYYAHKDAIDKKDQNEHSNNTQQYLLDTAHSLYENQDKHVQTQQIDILHDTGASITMLPSDFEFTWTNVRDSLHTISGCLKGTAEKYTQIGEFHALITLKSEVNELILANHMKLSPQGYLSKDSIDIACKLSISFALTRR